MIENFKNEESHLKKKEKMDGTNTYTSQEAKSVLVHTRDSNNYTTACTEKIAVCSKMVYNQSSSSSSLYDKSDNITNTAIIASNSSFSFFPFLANLILSTSSAITSYSSTDKKDTDYNNNKEKERKRIKSNHTTVVEIPNISVGEMARIAAWGLG